MSNLFAVDGTLIKSLRERRGLSQQELASLACLSVRQIKQIEDGGTSSFYNEDIKRKTMMKLVSMLELPSDVDSAQQSLHRFDSVPMRAEPLHELANPPAAPTADDQAFEANPREDVDSAEGRLAAKVNLAEQRDHQESSPHSGSRTLLWVSVALAIAVVAYGLGLIPV